MTVPTPVVRDLVLPAGQAQWVVDRLFHGRLSLFHESGLLPHVEHTDRFVAELHALIG